MALESEGVVGVHDDVETEDAGPSAESTASEEQIVALKFEQNCVCSPIVVDTKVHRKHEGLHRDNCHKCLEKILKLRVDWKEYYKKYANSATLVGLRRVWRMTKGKEPNDRTIMQLYTCALNYPSLMVRVYVHSKYGEEVLKEVECAHNDLAH